MTSTRPARLRSASRSQLLEAARLGAAVATADVSGTPPAARTAYARWRRLRRYAAGDSRRLLRVAFDTGYGRGVHAAASPVLPAATAGTRLQVRTPDGARGHD